MVLNEKLKQKQLIWEQIRRENERFKTIIIKRDYKHIDSINKKEKNQVLLFEILDTMKLKKIKNNNII